VRQRGVCLIRRAAGLVQTPLASRKGGNDHVYMLAGPHEIIRSEGKPFAVFTAGRGDLFAERMDCLRQVAHQLRERTEPGVHIGR